MAQNKINTYPTATPASTDYLLGTDRSDVSNDANGETVNFLVSALRTGVSVTGYEAAGDGTTDDSTAIQSAIDAVYAAGGGIVFFPAGTYVIGTTLEINDNVILKGEGHLATILKAADGLNDDVVRTADFSTQTGNNYWFVDTEGVHHGFGIVSLGIDGNKANNTSGCGIKIFGKRYVIDNVFIRDCADRGFYSETGTKGGQNDYRDMPECEINGLWIRACTNEGFYWAGPHDGHIGSLLVNSTGNASGKSGVYFASNGVDVGFIHSYATNSHAVDIQTTIRCYGEIIGETAGDAGINLNGSDGHYNSILVFAFNSNATNKAGVYLSGARNVINNLHVRNTDVESTCRGLVLAGADNVIGNAIIDGEGSGTYGIIVNANDNRVLNALIRDGWSEGIRAAGNTGTVINATIDGCTTAFNNQSTGAENRYDLHFGANTTDVTETAAQASTEDWIFTGETHGCTMSGNISGGIVLPSYAATAIADVSDAVNTSDKAIGKSIWDTTNNRVMVASGTAAASAWYVSDGSASVTPA